MKGAAEDCRSPRRFASYEAIEATRQRSGVRQSSAVVPDGGNSTNARKNNRIAFPVEALMKVCEIAVSDTMNSVPASANWKKRVEWGGLCFALACGVMLFFFPPQQYHFFYPQCFLYRWTGLQCPGCGGLRATHQLLHGHIVEAFRLNAYFVGALPLGVVWLVSWRLGYKKISNIFKTVWFWSLFGLGAIVFGVLRNL